jgi:hypothetical protein
VSRVRFLKGLLGALNALMAGGILLFATGNLHLTDFGASSSVGYGLPVPAGTTDFDGDVRGASVDLGADQYGGSALPPPLPPPLVSPINNANVFTESPTLRWTAPAGADANTWYYVLLQSNVDPAVSLDGWVQGATQLTLGPLSKFGSHSGWVEGQWSAEGTFQHKIQSPSGLTATVSVRWTDRSDNEAGFQIWRATGATSTSFTRVGTVGANATSFSQTVTRGTTYRYRVRAYNGTTYSAYTAMLNVTVP